jgi:hypothetical protein
MKKYIPHILSVWLIIGFSFLVPAKVLSQTNQKGNKMDTTNSVGAMPDGTSLVPTGITTGRARSLVGGVLGLISLVIGWRAKARSAKEPGSGRSWSIAALGLGFISIILSVVHLATTIGGFGTGGGRAGAIVALVLGLTGVALGGLALRSKGK